MVLIIFPYDGILKNIFENTFETQFQICRKEKKFKLLFIVILIEAVYKEFFTVDDE